MTDDKQEARAGDAGGGMGQGAHGTISPTSIPDGAEKVNSVNRTITVSVHPNLTRIPRDAAEKDRMVKMCAPGWKAQEMTVSELAAHVGKGRAIAAQFRAGYRRAANFEASQFVAVDLDHGPDVAGALAHPFAQAHYCIAGPSPSSTAEAPRTRLIFPLAEPITDLETYADLAGRLLHRLAELEPDQTSAQGERFVFGCKGSTVSDGALLTPGDLRALPAPPAQATPAIPRQPAPTGEATGDRPGDEFNARGEVGDVLLKHGWAFVRRVGQKDMYRRPGKSHGVSATFNAPEAPGRFYNFSENAAPFEAGKSYAPFAVYALLEHDGDYQAAARALAGAGYGAPLPVSAHIGSQENDAAASRNGDAPPPRFRHTDMGNAERLAWHHGDDLRHVPHNGKWLFWDGRRWCDDATGEIMRRAKDTVRAIYREAADADDDTRTKIARWAIQSETRGRLTAMIELAQSEPGIAVTPAQLDADPWLLTVLNGTLDLRTGELRPHARTDLITRLAPVEYDANAHLQLWADFLAEATRDDFDVMAFLRRAVGYSLTGEVSEEVLFFIHGPAASGKSTFIEAVKGALGDYAQTADFETFLARSMVGGARNDIARLDGARFVSSIEVDEGKRLAEGLIKQLTGGDKVAARFLYQDIFEFQPQAKLWLSANHAPKVNADDEAMWRRILRVPFEHTIPKAERDPRVKATLRDPAIAGPAILAWAVKGCLEWQHEGLRVPQVIDDATAAYRDEMNPLKPFFDEYCTFDPVQWAYWSTLWTAYSQYVEDNRIRFPVSQAEFRNQLRAKNCEPARKGEAQHRAWLGIGVVEE